MARKLALLSLAIMWIGACEPKVEPEPAPAPEPLTSPPTPEPPRDPELLPGVGPSGAQDRTARRQAVIDLLSNGSAAELPVDATERGEQFDPKLAEKLAPKLWVSDQPRSQRRSKVELGTVTVTGGLDQDTVRRMIRAHINEVRSCYNAGLNEKPKLAGRVTIDFGILPTGKVAGSVVSKSELSDAAVGNCIAKAVKRWSFAKPRDRKNVGVTCSFILRPK
jgi:outer membrane biosynthesis protein TonB